MHPIKWIRKNERKIMTFVVIFIMVAFVGGTAFTTLLRRLGRGGHEVVAYYGDNTKITTGDRATAQAELNALRVLMADKILRYWREITQTQTFRPLLLSQLLFPDSQSATLVNYLMKQEVTKGQFQVSGREIDDFFNRITGMSDIYWLLLKAEAKQAGCVVPNEEAKEMLRQIIPALTQRQLDAAQLVDQIAEKQRVSEEKVVSIFADLLGILAYSEIIIANEGVTTNQIRAVIGRNGEKIDAEFVKIDAGAFVDMQDEPTEEQIATQFEQYKKFYAGDISEENPYGFGYKLPARGKLDYLIVKLDDVRKLVEEPTQEEMEDYYRQNIGEFQYTQKTDPNNPDSEAITKTRSYAESLAHIREKMIDARTKRRADMVMNEAIDLTEADLANIDIELAGVEELKKFARDYKEAAVQLKNKYDIEVYVGQTGLLSDEDFAADGYLSNLAVEGQNRLPVPLYKVVFALEEIGVTKLGRFEVPRPKMWQNIGPIKDTNLLGSETMLVVARVIEAQKAAEPENVNVSFSKRGIVLGLAEADIYSVREQVINDWKLQKAMETTKSRAEKLVGIIAKKGWEDALAEFNETYSAKDTPEETELQLEKLTEQIRASQGELKFAEKFAQDNPASKPMVRQIVKDKKLLEVLYATLPAGETEALNTMSVIPFKPGASYYVIKSISRTAVTKQDYYMARAQTANQLDMIEAESLAIVHFDSENIFKRMKFRTPPSKDAESTENNGQKGEGSQ